MMLRLVLRRSAAMRTFAAAKRIGERRIDENTEDERAAMGEIPGKACGECSFCCKVLEIVEFKKPAGLWCEHCQKSGGCGVYETRPAVCRAYECLWKGDRALGAPLRPDRVGVILMEDPDSDEYRAVCDPAKPLAWRNPLVFRHLVAMAKAGRMVVAKAGLKSWRIRANGESGPCI
jgi:uncharacterized protein